MVLILPTLIISLYLRCLNHLVFCIPVRHPPWLVLLYLRVGIGANVLNVINICNEVTMRCMLSG